MTRKRKGRALRPKAGTGPASGPAPAREERSPPRRIGLAKGLLFAAIPTVTLFALFELVLWVAGAETLIEREDPFRGFSGLVTVFSREGDVYRTRPANTRFTFNDQSFLAAKPENGLRIFTLGGSSSFGFPWGAEAAFTSIVGEALAEHHPERVVEAVNASGTSYAMHRLNLVADELLSYEPDVFIVYSGHNEFIEPGFFEALKRRSAARNRLEYLLAHSRTYASMRSLAERMAKRPPSQQAGYDVDVRRDEKRVHSPEEKQAIVDEYRFRLGRLVRRARQAGVRVVLVTVPANLSEWRPEASRADTALTTEQQRRWSEAFLSGQRRLSGDRIDEAISDLERAARIDPQHAEGQFLLARAYQRAGRFGEASRAYERACDSDASPIRRVSGINDAIREVALEQGALLVDADGVFRALAEGGLVGFNYIEDYVHPTIEGHEIIAWHVTRAMEEAGWFGEPRSPDRARFDQLIAARRARPLEANATWFYNQAVVLADQGRRDAAIEKYREAIAIQPDYEVALLNLGHLLTQTGRNAEAVDVLTRLVALEPELTGPAAHVNLGNALYNLRRYGEAAEHYRAATQLDPDMGFAYTNLGNALRNLGRLEEALAQYAAADRIRPDDARNHNGWGRALGRLERAEEALSHFEEAVRLKPDFAEAYRNLGVTLLGLGRADEAAEPLRIALRLNPNDVYARRLLERTRLLSGGARDG